MPDDTFAQQFKSHLVSFLASEQGQLKIKRTVDDHDIGMLSRLFNDMKNFSDEAQQTALKELLQAKADDRLHEYVPAIIREMTDTLVCITPDPLNPDVIEADLTTEAQKAIGSENYKRLVSECNNNPAQLVNYILQAVTTLYSMVITAQYLNKSDNETPEETLRKSQDFQSNISQFFTRYNENLSVDTFNKPFEKLASTEKLASQEVKNDIITWHDIISNVLDDLMPFNEMYPTEEGESFVRRLNEWWGKLGDYKDRFEIGQLIPEKECNDLLLKSASNLADVATELPTAVTQYTKTSWLDAFWAFVSRITGKDYNTKQGKRVENLQKVSEFSVLTRARSLSRQSSIDSTQDEKDEDQENELHP